jgi:hypothetical protein
MSRRKSDEARNYFQHREPQPTYHRNDNRVAVGGKAE